MMSRVLSSLLLSVAAVLAGCQSVPPTNVHQPMTARPAPKPDLAHNNGAIFNPVVSRSLFEDRRARYVGDTLTINIVENTSASTNSSSSANRTSSLSASVPTITGLPARTSRAWPPRQRPKTISPARAPPQRRTSLPARSPLPSLKSWRTATSLVSGEKQVAIGHGQEYIRLSGVVNPTFISATNTIASSRVADARVEYKESGYISEAQVMGWLARFFLSFMPF